MWSFLLCLYWCFGTSIFLGSFFSSFTFLLGSSFFTFSNYPHSSTLILSLDLKLVSSSLILSGISLSVNKVSLNIEVRFSWVNSASLMCSLWNFCHSNSHRAFWNEKPVSTDTKWSSASQSSHFIKNSFD